ncbi:MAG: 5'-nucleotidase C-terminal domain-containing protein [Pseudomonadota bacterium]
MEWRHLSNIATIVFIIVLACVPAEPADAGTSFGITILHMNDTHGHYSPEKARGSDILVGGFARAATLIESIVAENRAKGRETLVLHAGDILTGTPLSVIFKGEESVALMNRMGFQAMAIGNHEFDNGYGHLSQKLRPAASFPFLSANITNESGAPVFDTKLVKEYPDAGLRLVVFGLTTPNAPTSTYPRNVTGLTFKEPAVAAEHTLRGYGERDLVVALTHLGVKEDLELAKACPIIDVIVGGHSHTALEEPAKVGKTIIAQAGAYSQHLGRLDLEVKDGLVVSHRGVLMRLVPDIPEHPQVAAKIKEYEEKAGPHLRDVIGRTDVYLEGGHQAVRSGRNCDLGRLVTFAMLKRARADAAIINGGSIRAGLNKGNITLGDMYTVFPFPNSLATVELTGEELTSVMRRSEELPLGSGGKLQTYGLELQDENGHVAVNKVGAKSFNPKDKYSIAVSDFLLAGGDGYEILKSKQSAANQSYYLIGDLVVELIKERSNITSEFVEYLRNERRP